VDLTRVILVSDTHLSPRAPESVANWDAVLRYVSVAAPDLVIHLGDLSMDGVHDADDLRFGRRQLDRLAVPWHAVPGNHDIGDNPRPSAPADWAVDASRVQRWLDIVGPDRWSLTINGWTLLGLNAQLAGTGLAAEASQWSWLEERVRERDASQPIALVMHKPLAATEAELAAAPSYRFLPAPGRQRVADLFGDKPPALVLSGHVHQNRQLRLDGTDHLWVPTTWAVLPDEVQPVLGTKQSGLLSLEFRGRSLPQSEFIEPDGISQLTIVRDLPDPYHPA
jgi:3',5'-cyclic AMP phosphodiesterase CpdA